MLNRNTLIGIGSILLISATVGLATTPTPDDQSDLFRGVTIMPRVAIITIMGCTS